MHRVCTLQVQTSLSLTDVPSVDADGRPFDAAGSASTASLYADQTKVRLMTYSTYLALFVGASTALLAVAYRYVTMKYARIEDETDRLEERKDELRLTNRVTLAKGTECRVVHLVDKPQLNEHRATIETGPDKSGLLSVFVDGVEMKV